MKGVVPFCLGISLLGMAVLGRSQTPGDEAAATQAAAQLQLETLLSAELEGVENTDVIVSRVTIPPNTSLPKHWHPGEEFAYVLEGSAALWLDGELHSTSTTGALVKVPLKRVHTAITGEEGATILVFRVHERGQPERILVD